MTYLLDGNVLVALSFGDHPHHERADRWFTSCVDAGDAFATCPLTEGTLLRLHMQYAVDATFEAARRALIGFRRHPAHCEWLENFSYEEVPHAHILGHRQVTDAWLVELARRRGGKLASLDAALATLHADVAELVPVVI